MDVLLDRKGRLARIIGFKLIFLLNMRPFFSAMRWILAVAKISSEWILTYPIFLRRWILTQLFWKRGELMVNLDPTNFFIRGEQRWRLEEGRFKVVFDGCISKPCYRKRLGKTRVKIHLTLNFVRKCSLIGQMLPKYVIQCFVMLLLEIAVLSTCSRTLQTDGFSMNINFRL